VGGACGTNGGKRTAYRLLVKKPKGKRQLGKPGLRWVINIKTYAVEMELDGLDWIVLAQDRYKWRAVVNAIMKLLVP
jgi:hypothetical protein